VVPTDPPISIKSGFYLKGNDTMCKNVDFADMSWDELEALEKAIHFEKVHRKEKRFNELAKAAADALTILKDEYPYVELTFEAHCECCGESTEVNLFDYFKHFGAGHFSMG
jgi:hypothetical protein